MFPDSVTRRTEPLLPKVASLSVMSRTVIDAAWTRSTTSGFPSKVASVMDMGPSLTMEMPEAPPSADPSRFTFSSN